jgi:hypothetical protein
LLASPIEAGHFTVIPRFGVERTIQSTENSGQVWKGGQRRQREFITRPGTFCMLLNVDDMGKVKGSCDVQETQFLCGLTIKRIVRIYGHV